MRLTTQYQPTPTTEQTKVNCGTRDEKATQVSVGFDVFGGYAFLMNHESDQPPTAEKSTKINLLEPDTVDGIRRDIVRFTQAICDTLGATDAEMLQALDGARDYWQLRSVDA